MCYGQDITEFGTRVLPNIEYYLLMSFRSIHFHRLLLFYKWQGILVSSQGNLFLSLEGEICAYLRLVEMSLIDSVCISNGSFRQLVIL